MEQTLEQRAFQYALKAHEGQFRKSPESKRVPYIVHPRRVADMVKAWGGSKRAIAVALLHDVVEDCGEEHYIKIFHKFGVEIAGMVDLLSKPTMTMRKGKPNYFVKKRYLARLLHTTPEVVSIKIADRLDNLRSMADAGWDTGRQHKYLDEAEELIQIYLAVVYREDPQWMGGDPNSHLCVVEIHGEVQRIRESIKCNTLELE